MIPNCTEVTFRTGAMLSAVHAAIAMVNGRGRSHHLLRSARGSQCAGLHLLSLKTVHRGVQMAGKIRRCAAALFAAACTSVMPGASLAVLLQAGARME